MPQGISMHSGRQLLGTARYDSAAGLPALPPGCPPHLGLSPTVLCCFVPAGSVAPACGLRLAALMAPASPCRCGSARLRSTSWTRASRTPL